MRSRTRSHLHYRSALTINASQIDAISASAITASAIAALATVNQQKTCVPSIVLNDDDWYTYLYIMKTLYDPLRIKGDISMDVLRSFDLDSLTGKPGLPRLYECIDLIDGNLDADRAIKTLKDLKVNKRTLFSNFNDTVIEEAVKLGEDTIEPGGQQNEIVGIVTLKPNRFIVKRTHTIHGSIPRAPLANYIAMVHDPPILEPYISFTRENSLYTIMPLLEAPTDEKPYVQVLTNLLELNKNSRSYVMTHLDFHRGQVSHRGTLWDAEGLDIHSRIDFTDMAVKNKADISHWKQAVACSSNHMEQLMAASRTLCTLGLSTSPLNHEIGEMLEHVEKEKAERERGARSHSLLQKLIPSWVTPSAPQSYQEKLLSTMPGYMKQQREELKKRAKTMKDLFHKELWLAISGTCVLFLLVFGMRRPAFKRMIIEESSAALVPV